MVRGGPKNEGSAKRTDREIIVVMVVLAGAFAYGVEAAAENSVLAERTEQTVGS